MRHFNKVISKCFFFLVAFGCLQTANAQVATFAQPTLTTQLASMPSLRFNLLEGDAPAQTQVPDGAFGVLKQSCWSASLYRYNDGGHDLALIGGTILGIGLFVGVLAIVIGNIYNLYSARYSTALGVLGILLGAVFTPFVIGIPVLVMGIVNVYKASKTRRVRVSDNSAQGTHTSRAYSTNLSLSF